MAFCPSGILSYSGTLSGGILSGRPSVLTGVISAGHRPSHAGVLAKQLNVGDGETPYFDIFMFTQNASRPRQQRRLCLSGQERDMNVGISLTL